MAFPRSKPWLRTMAELVALSWPTDASRVLDLCERARDYIELETGQGPDAAYVHETMTDAPPTVPPEQVWCWGANNNGTLCGIATCLKGFYNPDDWYLGLLLLDPAVRDQGLGTRMAHHIITQAHAEKAACLRIAVLDSNPRGRAFWQQLGFRHEKSTTAGDGQLRHVHRLRFERATT